MERRGTDGVNQQVILTMLTILSKKRTALELTYPLRDKRKVKRVNKRLPKQNRATRLKLKLPKDKRMEAQILNITTKTKLRIRSRVSIECRQNARYHVSNFFAILLLPKPQATVHLHAASDPFHGCNLLNCPAGPGTL